MSKTYYLGVFPTPGGDKHHLFTLEAAGGGLTGTVANSQGVTVLENLTVTPEGFAADMPAGPGKHHFDAAYIQNGLQVKGTVIMEGKAVGTYEAQLASAADDTLPADPEGPGGGTVGPGHEGPGGPPQQH